MSSGHELELAYLGLEVPDVAAFDALFADVVGAAETAPGPDGAHRWRLDDKAYRIAVHEGERGDAAYIGFEATTKQSFDAVVARLAAAGYECTPGTEAERAARGVGELVWTVAPWETRVELVRDLTRATTPFASALVPGGFLTEGMGFGHVVFSVTDLAALDGFAQALGLRQSDWLEMKMGPHEIRAVFYHCNERHHTLAAAGLPVEPPRALHHLMVEARNQDDVGAAYDRALGAGLTIANGLGKHDNDEMFSFYVVTPAGFQLEFGSGARRITEPWTDNRAYDRISRWGHQPIVRA